MQSSRDISRLLEIMAALRHPKTGCGWDVQQTFETISPFTIEEAYEVADAIGRRDMADLKDELGDLLLQVVFHSQIAEEAGHFDFGGVVQSITQKMIRRHPHVFDENRELSPAQAKASWAAIKAAEKLAREDAPDSGGLMGDVPLALPGLTRAVKLQRQAATIGFDWDDARLVLDKIREETAEVEEALDLGESDAIREEIGDLLCAVANLARHVSVDPEDAIRGSNAKFERRFRFIETELARQRVSPGTATLEQMEDLWNSAKAQEKRSKSS
ncbi:nucleoside triphosphate pyrophosphohydrolase [Methylocapsa palsarum]|uniref:ATP diphosphatase n=1 Tax=Methylocapsa palsarum TaxID=1612308 RepID=A0A1I3Y9G3_9HYPH|nr:nucleoside triphosphate pyrophosphohydrolase [Methylocapsa palsarum]SFK28413.1 ATP diphosphatase [Methylocapsa palsarum]